MSYHVNPIAPVLPRLGARSVGALGATAPALREAPIEPRINYITTNYGADAGAFFRSCMFDKLRPSGFDCNKPAMAIATLKGAQLDFYKNCMTQRPSDVPVYVQHNACFAEAQKLSDGSAAAPAPAATPDQAPAMAPAAPSSNKWMWIGGAVVAAGLAYVVLKK